MSFANTDSSHRAPFPGIELPSMITVLILLVDHLFFSAWNDS